MQQRCSGVSRGRARIRELLLCSQWLSRVRLLEAPRSAACQTSFTASWSLLKLKSVKSVMLSGSSGGAVVKNPPMNEGNQGSIPGSVRSVGEGNDNSLQCSCLRKPMDRGAWRVTVHGVQESDTAEHTHSEERHLGKPKA